MKRSSRLALLLGGGTLFAGLISAQEPPVRSEPALKETPPVLMDSGARAAPAAAPASVSEETVVKPSVLDVAAPIADTLAVQDALTDVNLSHNSDKVGFSGVLYSRGFNHRYLKMPEYLWPDASRTSMDANFTLKVGVNATSFLKAWSMVSFGYDFAGHFQNQKASNHIRTVDLTSVPGIQSSVSDTVTGDYSRAPYLQDKNRESARIFEDLSAGVDIRTEPVDANIRAGSALWIEGSPFTIWKRDPRPKLAWYYETYEPEQSSYQYYTQKFFYRHNDLGRLSWPKKPFGGIEADAFKMPFDMGLQLDFAQPSNMLPTKTDGNEYNAPGDAEALGSINSLGQLYYGRLTKKKAFADVIVGANALWVELPEDIINQTVISSSSATTQGFRYQFRKGDVEPFFTKPRVFSLDARGNLNSKYFIQADLALAYEDSVLYHVPDSLANDTSLSGANYNGYFPRTYAKSKPNPAVYLKLNNSGTLPMETELFYAAKEFWSPYAMTEYAVPVHRDEIKLGTGSFSYQPNLMGMSWKVSPKVTTGFLSLTLGEHVQADKGKDIVRFQHNLNGREEWNASSSWSRTEPGRLIDEGVPYFNPRYEARLGEGQRNTNPLYLQAQPGGLRGDDQELWEEFAAYDDISQAASGIVPQSRKIASSLALDWGYDLGPVIGYSRNFMLVTYGAVNSIAKDLTGPVNSKETLLWSALGRFEAVLSLSPTFQMIGLVGVENWRSDKTYRNLLYNKQNTNSDLNHQSTFMPLFTPAGDTLKDADNNVIKYNNILAYESISSATRDGDQRANPLVIPVASPIDFLQTAYGIGFDWDFTARAGLHVRYKYATHQDKNLPDNNWNGSFFFAETKLWF
ncbi:MAG: hypothetical protein JWO30_1856 [Fibrobacteres bacterium]|nr:hypothetical protein [Fibrobacterota bacterium]